MTGTKPQIHHSHLRQLWNCGRHFQRRYGARFGVHPVEETYPMGIDALAGIAVHRACEKNLQNMADNNGTPLPRKDIEPIIQAEFSGLCDRGFRIAKKIEDPDAHLHEQLEMAVSLALLHYDEVAPNLKPVRAEQNWVIELPEYPFDLSGTIDIIEAGGYLRDIKTTKAAMSTAATTQMALYCTAYKVASQSKEQAEKFGIPYCKEGAYPKRVYLDILKKLKTPKVQVVGATPDDSWILPMLARVKQAIEFLMHARDFQMKGGNPDILFTPTTGDDWACTDDWCPYATHKTNPCEFFLLEKKNDEADQDVTGAA